MRHGWDVVGRASIAFLVVVVALVPRAQALSQHGDEAHYGWSAAYFGQKAAALDFRPWGDAGARTIVDGALDFGWSPQSWWTLTQPMGARLVYAVVIGALALDVPRVPYSYADKNYEGPAHLLSPATLLALRYAAVACAALGFALLAARLGWQRGAPLLLVLLVAHVRDDLARAWAEGPLLLGIGLAALTWRTRSFGVACGLVAAFKLTGLALWPLLLWPGSSGDGRLARLLGAAAALVTWCLLTPPSWFGGGPLFLVTMIVHRGAEYRDQAALVPGITLPLASRYLLPAELLAVFIAAEFTTRVLGQWRSRGRRHPLVADDPSAAS